MHPAYVALLVVFSVSVVYAVFLNLWFVRYLKRGGVQLTLYDKSFAACRYSMLDPALRSREVDILMVSQYISFGLGFGAGLLLAWSEGRLML